MRRSGVVRRAAEYTKIHIAIDLAAGETDGELLVRVTLDLDDAPVPNLYEHGAHVGAVVGADGSDIR